MQTETKWGKSKKRASKNCWKIHNDIVKSKLKSRKEEREKSGQKKYYKRYSGTFWCFPGGSESKESACNSCRPRFYP